MQSERSRGTPESATERAFLCRSVALVSGGLDSAVTLALATREAPPVLAATFAYGQRHQAELAAAARVARACGVEHVVIELDASPFAGSALTSASVAVPKDRLVSGGSIETPKDIPPTYVPARNLVFLSLAAALAESRGASDIWIGVNAVDYSGYPDCRPAFIEAMQRCVDTGLRSTAQGEDVRLRAPLLRMRKGEIVALGVTLGVDFAATLSCYDPADSGAPCLRCDACLLRAQGFADAGMADPAVVNPG